MTWKYHRNSIAKVSKWVSGSGNWVTAWDGDSILHCGVDGQNFAYATEQGLTGPQAAAEARAYVEKRHRERAVITKDYPLRAGEP